MLIGFSVSNFKSFADTQTISFFASKISRHSDHVVKLANKKILKSAVVFGANAGGKTNLIKAVDFSRRIILFGTDKVDLNKKYFRISNDAYRIPGVFEYRFIVDETEYSYGIAISYEKKEIIAEWLVKIDSKGNEISIFDREYDEEGISRVYTEKVYDTEEENLKMKVYLDDFGENISDVFKRRTILMDIAERVNDKQGIFREITSVYEWFKNIIVVFPNSKYNGLNNIVSSDEKKSFFSNLISYFDTGIESIEGKRQTLDFEKIIQNFPPEDAEKIKIDISNATDKHPVMLKANQQIFILVKDRDGNIVYDKLQLNHGNDKDLFEYSDESDGTKRLFDLIPLYYESRHKSVIFVDEIDRSLHTNLIKKFIGLFYELTEEMPCQLIATTHDSNLLDLDLVRQDEIWFVERQEKQNSKIYSLNKYKERFDKKIDKEYLLGRYGAIPIFDENIIEGEFIEEE